MILDGVECGCLAFVGMRRKSVRTVEAARRAVLQGGRGGQFGSCTAEGRIQRQSGQAVKQRFMPRNVRYSA